MGGEEEGRRYDQSAMQYNASCVYMEDNPFKYWVPQHTSSNAQNRQFLITTRSVLINPNQTTLAPTVQIDLKVQTV